MGVSVVEYVPYLSCICCTYARPQFLREAVECFLRQDYPADRCELIVVDDCGQYLPQDHWEPKRWFTISSPQRALTIGEKRNASAAFASPQVDAYVVWDDDDLYLPHTLQAHAAALTQAPWSLPSLAWNIAPDGGLQLKKTGGLFHAAWAFSREAFHKVRGYPWMQSGQDQAIAARLRGCRFSRCDPIELGYPPFFMHRWKRAKKEPGSYHLSCVSKVDGYERLASLMHTGPKLPIDPGWDQDYAALAARAWETRDGVS